jgi:tRNA(Ile)-lysidine synthase
MIQSRFNNDFDNLLKGSTPKEMAIAVSGGVDSIALLHLVSFWALGANVKLSIFIVNHNLRSEASEEVQYVKSIAEKLGCNFFELSWHCGDNKIALQERARQGRYDLMSSKCHELAIDTLLTAHHLDDMLETYLMRENKKSGVFGLSSAPSFFHNNIRVLRPLFNCSKNELIEFLQNQDIQWREDVTNKSDLYERNRFRKQITLLTGAQKDALKNKVQITNEHALQLNKQLLIIMAESLQINNYGFASIDSTKLRKACLDIQIQILNYVVTVIAGKNIVPRFRSLEKLLDKFLSNETINCSLHGCVVKETKGTLWIFREKSAIEKSLVKLSLSQYWDNRFAISIEKPTIDNYIGRLSFDEYVSIKDKINLSLLAEISDNNHKLILFTLPVIKNIEKVVAIPHISYYDGFGQNTINEVVFGPNFISRFTHFL